MDQPHAPNGRNEYLQNAENLPEHTISVQASPEYHALPPRPVLDSPPSNPRPVATANSDEGAELRLQGAQDDDHSQKISAVDLPVEILQHIFSFVSPVSLGRLLWTCRLFNTLLDPSKPLPATSTFSTLGLVLQPQNDVWSQVRRTAAADHPRPMEDMTELDMWRLISGHSCQFCEKKPKNKIPLLAASPWSAGPGPDGVRTIWPFRCRACGPCLEARIVKETDLLLSSKSVLLHGLPSAFFTPSLNYVTSVTLRTLQPPPRLSLTKYFFQPQLDNLAEKESEVRGFGPAATQEWYKGLEAQGTTHMKDSARFEQWHHGTHPLVQLDPSLAGQISGSTSPAYSMASSAVHSHQFSLQSPQRPFSAQSTPLHSGLPATQSNPVLTPYYAMPLPTYPSAPGQSSQADQFATSPYPIQHIGAGAFPPPPKPRNVQEIERLKTQRRTEIQRRCLELDPPIQPSTLAFMSAFDAAVQIARPLTDSDWETLKERLLTQRHAAETRERDNQVTASKSLLEHAGQQNSEQERQETQANAQKVWDGIQKPSRDKAREHAEEYIRVTWAEGRAVNKASSAKFAADTLTHVKCRYTELRSQEDALLASQPVNIPQDSPIHELRRLKLEDMKHVYDQCIRPHIDRFGREIFLCHSCETNAKRFTFDAVIQHFAAKHTNVLGHGNTVVYWRADWPDESPFHPSPDTVWNRPPEHRAPIPLFSATSPAYTPSFTPYSGASWMSPIAPGQPNGIYHVQCEELVASAKRIWDAIDQIRYLPDSVRLHVVIHQVARRFSRRYTNEPTLSMFTDCIDHKPLLKSLKDVDGLVCKACQQFGTSVRDTYTLSELLQHFQRSHVEYDATSPRNDPSLSRLDWKHDMVELPGLPAIRNVMYSPGINQEKLDTIAEALPSYFPQPLPRVASVPYEQESHIPPFQDPFEPAGHLPESESKATGKRPLEEEPYSYRSPVRRVVEYDPYRPHPFQSGGMDWQPVGTLEHEYHSFVPGERIVYVETRPEPSLFYHGQDPFPPRAQPIRQQEQRSIYDDPPRRVIHEVPTEHATRLLGSGYVLKEVVPDAGPSVGEDYAPRRPTTDESALSAAENFLNTFDPIAQRDHEDSENQPRASHSRSRPHTPGQLPPTDGPLSSRSASRNPAPSDTIPGRHRSRQQTPGSPNEMGAEATKARDSRTFAPPPFEYTRSYQVGQERPVMFRGHAEEGSSYRGEGAVPYEYDSYADDRSQPHRGSTYVYRYASPEGQSRRYEEHQPVRYLETLSNGQRRIVEELPPSPAFERLDYVPGPRQYVARPSNYASRPAYRSSRAGPPSQYRDEAGYHPTSYQPASSSANKSSAATQDGQNIKYEDNP